LLSTPHQWFAYAHLPDPNLPRSSAVTFPKRSPPWLFTSAALGGLKPAPASRLRGALPHLLRSIVAHFQRQINTFRLPSHARIHFETNPRSIGRKALAIGTLFAGPPMIRVLSTNRPVSQ